MVDVAYAVDSALCVCSSLISEMILLELGNELLQGEICAFQGVAVGIDLVEDALVGQDQVDVGLGNAEAIVIGVVGVDQFQFIGVASLAGNSILVQQALVGEVYAGVVDNGVGSVSGEQLQDVAAVVLVGFLCNQVIGFVAVCGIDIQNIGSIDLVPEVLACGALGADGLGFLIDSDLEGFGQVGQTGAGGILQDEGVVLVLRDVVGQFYIDVVGNLVADVVVSGVLQLHSIFADGGVADQRVILVIDLLDNNRDVRLVGDLHLYVANGVDHNQRVGVLFACIVFAVTVLVQIGDISDQPVALISQSDGRTGPACISCNTLTDDDCVQVVCEVAHLFSIAADGLDGADDLGFLLQEGLASAHGQVQSFQQSVQILGVCRVSEVQAVNRGIQNTVCLVVTVGGVAAAIGDGQVSAGCQCGGCQA